jgi:GTP1/Obg family GTP-binding protein
MNKPAGGPMRKQIPIMAIFFSVLASLMMVETPDFAQEITAESLELDGSRLQSFAKVYVEFEKIRDIYLPRLKKAQTAQEINDIEKQARVRIDQALKKEGLTPESYSQIINKLNTDTELRAKAMQLIDEQRKNS